MSRDESRDPIAYGIEHVDTDLHASFPLTRRAPIIPAPIVAITNVRRAHHTQQGMCQVISKPAFTRVILKGDWT